MDKNVVSVFSNIHDFFASSVKEAIGWKLITSSNLYGDSITSYCHCFILVILKDFRSYPSALAKLGTMLHLVLILTFLLK